MATMLQIMANTKQAQAALQGLSAQYVNMSATIGTASRLADTAVRLLAASFIGLGAGAFVAYNAVSRFNESLIHVQALGDLTTQQINELAASITEVASEFGYSGDVIAEGAVILSKAGLSIDEINSSLREMTMLAKANAMSFEQAAEITVFAIESFDKAFTDVPDVLDKIQVAAQASILDVSDLQKSFAYAGSTANMTGISFEQLISIMAVLSNRALEAGISARSVNKMFLDILQSIPEMQKWGDAMGFNFDVVADGKINIDEIIHSFGEMGLSIDLLEQSTDIFTVRALRSWGLLLMASDDYFDMLNMVNNASGTLEKQTAVMMQSFTAQFSKLKEEILALLRTEEAMAAVGDMVEAFVRALNDLGPDFANAIIAATGAFTAMIEGGFLENLAGILELMFNLFPALKQVFDTLNVGGGIVLKLVFAMSILRLAAGGTIGQFLMLGIQYRENAIQLTSLTRETINLNATKEGLIQKLLKEENGVKRINIAYEQYLLGLRLNTIETERWMATLRMVQFAIQGVVQAISMGVSMGAMWAMTTNDMMKGALALMGIMQALNIVLGLYTALQSVKHTGIAAAILLPIALTAMYASYAAFKEEMEAVEIQTADTGMFVSGQRTYDTGASAAPRHRLVYVEPGEQIISKTQGMVGMGGGGITVNVGDVYAQDGTDFAEKLAAALPVALRNVSYRGAF